MWRWSEKGARILTSLRCACWDCTTRSAMRTPSDATSGASSRTASPIVASNAWLVQGRMRHTDIRLVDDGIVVQQDVQVYRPRPPRPVRRLRPQAVLDAFEKTQEIRSG